MISTPLEQTALKGSNFVRITAQTSPPWGLIKSWTAATRYQVRNANTCQWLRARTYIYPITYYYSDNPPHLTMTAKEKSKVHSNANIIIETFRLGGWKFRIAKTSQKLAQIKSAVPLCYRLCSDIFTLEPRLFTFFIFCKIWEGVNDSLLMHFSSLLLRRVCHN